jgi:hypothetical protein
LLQSSRAALERLQDPNVDADRQLVADLEAFCARLEKSVAAAPVVGDERTSRRGDEAS